jgi:RNA polymerase sigma factor (sigma-70 family)
VAGITGFFARRGLDPQTVADLTSETFAQAIASRASYDPRVGAPRPWLFGIARMVFARHCERGSRHDEALERLGGRVELDDDEMEELTARIDSQRRGADLLTRLAVLPELERQAIELVDLDGLLPKDAAASLGISPGALRVRLFRARNKLRKDNR